MYIYIIPQKENGLTDEDCGGTANNLSRNQLLCEVETVFNCENYENEKGNLSKDDNDSLPFCSSIWEN